MGRHAYSCAWTPWKVVSKMTASTCWCRLDMHFQTVELQTQQLGRWLARHLTLQLVHPTYEGAYPVALILQHLFQYDRQAVYHRLGDPDSKVRERQQVLVLHLHFKSDISNMRLSASCASYRDKHHAGTAQGRSAPCRLCVRTEGMHTH